MEKPIQVRQTTWNFLSESYAKLAEQDNLKILSNLGYIHSQEMFPANMLEIIAARPGRYLVHAGILEYPDLFRDTVVEDEDGLEYIIDGVAAEIIKSGSETVAVIRLYDKTRHVIEVSKVVDWITNHELFDQLSDRENN